MTQIISGERAQSILPIMPIGDKLIASGHAMKNYTKHVLVLQTLPQHMRARKQFGFWRFFVSSRTFIATHERENLFARGLINIMQIRPTWVQRLKNYLNLQENSIQAEIIAKISLTNFRSD